MRRTLDQWVNCDPATMATMSQAAIMYAFRDAKCDIKELHDLVKRFCNAIADEHTKLLFLKREAENIIGATKAMQQHGENVANFMDKKYPNLY